MVGSSSKTGRMMESNRIQQMTAEYNIRMSVASSLQVCPLQIKLLQGCRRTQETHYHPQKGF